MTKQQQYAEELEKYAKKVESGEKSDISFILQENFSSDQHIMLIEDKKIFALQKSMLKMQKENYLLEKVDLIDYWKIFENGRTNKTR